MEVPYVLIVIKIFIGQIDMDFFVPVEIDFENELPIPWEWRPTILKISEKIRLNESDFEKIEGVLPISDYDFHYIIESVRAYGEDLKPLPDEAWETSIYQASGDGWSVMIDLFTVQSGRSDLVLFLKVKKFGSKYQYSVESVHVP